MPELPDPAERLRSASYRVAVVEEARIVERGERRVKWFVRHQGSWLAVGEHPTVNVDTEAVGEPERDSEETEFSQRCPPGTVWQRHYELSLARGTPLMSVSTAPRVRRESTLWYLSHGLGRAEVVYQQRQFVVAGNYRLVPRGEMKRGAAQRGVKPDSSRQC
jgi:hypothetical protein